MSPDRRDETPRNRAGRDISNGDAPDDTRAHTDTQDDAAIAATEDSSHSRSTTETGDRADAENDPEASLDEAFGPVEDAGPRDIVVPPRLFKLVTVVTTLLAVPIVVLGFMFLDAATLQTSVARGTVLFVVNWLGLPIDESIVSALLGLVGIGLIGLGAGIYVVGSRFRAAGMGNAEEDTDEQSTNG